MFVSRIYKVCSYVYCSGTGGVTISSLATWCLLEIKVSNRGWDGWMASPTQWTWVWVNSGSWCWTGRPGVLRFMGLQRVGHDWATKLNWTELKVSKELKIIIYIIKSSWNNWRNISVFEANNKMYISSETGSEEWKCVLLRERRSMLP